ncbi:MAG: acyl-CoA thioesterase [Acidobacteria bacterium]|nr:acyl-CoA thioesterase [Acidobacteriota bacterium]
MGRTEWLRATGWSYREMEREGLTLPVIEAHCEYRQPARYDDEVEIATQAARLTPVRIRFDNRVTRAADGTLSAVGYTVHAAVDTAGKPRRLPPRVRDMLPFDVAQGTQSGSRGVA